jgi:hypothetical protein
VSFLNFDPQRYDEAQIWALLELLAEPILLQQAEAMAQPKPESRDFRPRNRLHDAKKKKNHCHTRATGTASHHHRFSLKKSQHHRTWRLHKSDPSCRAQRTSVAGGSAHPRRLRWQLEEKRNQMVVSQLV